MSPLALVVTSGLAMSAIALVGSLTLVLRQETLQRIMLPLVGLAAGALLVVRCSTCCPNPSMR